MSWHFDFGPPNSTVFYSNRWKDRRSKATYQQCSNDFGYSDTHAPRRVLTKLSKGGRGQLGELVLHATMVLVCILITIIYYIYCKVSFICLDGGFEDWLCKGLKRNEGLWPLDLTYLGTLVAYMILYMVSQVARTRREPQRGTPFWPGYQMLIQYTDTATVIAGGWSRKHVPQLHFPCEFSLNLLAFQVFTMATTTMQNMTTFAEQLCRTDCHRMSQATTVI